MSAVKHGVSVPSRSSLIHCTGFGISTTLALCPS